jgi:hypothetical protein
LLLEDLGCRLRSVEGAVEVDSHDLAPLLRAILLRGLVGRHAGVGDNDVQLAKLLGDLLNDSLDVGLVAHVGLVCGRADIVGGCDLCGDVDCLLRCTVDDGDLFFFVIKTVIFKGVYSRNRRTLAPASARALETSSPMPRAPPRSQFQ